MKKIFEQKGQSFVETAIVLPIIVILILIIIQFSILITCKLAVNFAAYKAARAVLLSSNKSQFHGFGNENSVVEDARHSVRGTLSIFYPYTGLGWMLLPSVDLHRHSGDEIYGIAGNRIKEENMAQPPNQTLWVIVRSKAVIVIPLVRPVFGKFFNITGLLNLKATCLVDTPSQP